MTVIVVEVDVTDAIQSSGSEICPHPAGARSLLATARLPKLATSLPAASRSTLSVPVVGLV